MARADRRVDGRTGPAGQVEGQAGDGLSCGTPETNGSRVRHPCCRARRPGGSDRGTARPLASPWPTFPHMAYLASGLFPRRSPDAETPTLRFHRSAGGSVHHGHTAAPTRDDRAGQTPKRPRLRTAPAASTPRAQQPRQDTSQQPPDKSSSQAQAQAKAEAQGHTEAPTQTEAPAEAPARAGASPPAQRHPPSTPPTGTVSRQPAIPEPTSPRPPVDPRPTWPARCRRPRPSRAPAARYPTGAATRVRWRRVRAPRR